jgi:hypothetical protein
MDHAGAVTGPLVSSALLAFFLEGDLRKVFAWAAIPSVLAMVVLWFGVREDGNSPKSTEAETRAQATSGASESSGPLGARFKLLLLSLAIFTLGNSTDAFLLVRLADAGISASLIPLLWALHSLVKMASTYFGGRFSDRTQRRAQGKGQARGWQLLAGWAWYVGIYVAFALAHSQWALICVFLAYGIFYGLTEPTERAWVSDLAPSHLRGSAFGYYHMVVGLGALPASLLFGAIWKAWGSSAAFLTGAALAALASLGVLRLLLMRARVG